MNNIKKILEIIFLLVLVFGGYKVFWYLFMFPKIETKINSQIFIINEQVNSIKPEVDKTIKDMDNLLLTIEDISNELLRFWKVLDETLLILNEREARIEDFDKILKSLEPILNDVNKNLKLINWVLVKISPSLEEIEINTISINEKLLELKKIWKRRQELLDKLINYNITDTSKKLLDRINKKLKEQKVINQTIQKSEEILENIEKILPRNSIYDDFNLKIIK